MPKSSGKHVTYSHQTKVPKFNLMSLDLKDIENELEYLLFVEHEEDMKGYTHLLPILSEVAKLVVHISDRAVAEFQRDMTHRIAKNLQGTIGENIGNVIYDAQINTQNDATVSVTIDDEKVVETKTEVGQDIRDW